MKLFFGVLGEVCLTDVTQVTVDSLMPRRALGVLSGIARRGAAGKPGFAKGTGSLFRQSPTKTTERREQAA
jgi:hypothetical protein